MRTLRLIEVLLPLLAARGWAPWPVEPGVRRSGTARVDRLSAAPRQARWRDRTHHRLPFDDVQ